jgi:hypothetical protein
MTVIAESTAKQGNSAQNRIASKGRRPNNLAPLFRSGRPEQTGKGFQDTNPQPLWSADNAAKGNQPPSPQQFHQAHACHLGIRIRGLAKALKWLRRQARHLTINRSF